MPPDGSPPDGDATAPETAAGPSVADRLSAGAVAPRDVMPRWVPRAIALFFAGVVGLAVVSWLLGELRELIVTLLIAIFISFALEPAVNRLAARGWRRGVATAFVFVVFLLLVLVFVAALTRLMADEVSNLIEASPGYLQDLEDWVNQTFDLQISGEDLRSQLTDADGPIRSFATQAAGNALGISASVLGILFQLLTISLFVFYMVADGPRLRRLICSFLRPDRQRRVLETWEIAMDKTGGYIYSRGLLSLISGVAHWIAFEIIGVPYAIALAAFVGVVSQFVPVIGTYLAGAFPALIALANDPVDSLYVVGFVIVYQQIENYLLSPRVTARTMDLHPAVAFGSVLVGISLLGGVGALLALPFSAVVQALGSTYVERHPVIESSMTETPTEAGRSSWSARARRAWRDRHGGSAP